MSGMLSLMNVQSLFQFGEKWGNERAITGIKIILTCSLSIFKVSAKVLVCNLGQNLIMTKTS